MEKSNTHNYGIGFAGLLTIAFIVLKLCKVISWSWLWVLSPLWLQIPVFFIAIVILHYKTRLTVKDIEERMKDRLKNSN